VAVDVRNVNEDVCDFPDVTPLMLRVRSWCELTVSSTSWPRYTMSADSAAGVSMTRLRSFWSVKSFWPGTRCFVSADHRAGARAIGRKRTCCWPLHKRPPTEYIPVGLQVLSYREDVVTRPRCLKSTAIVHASKPALLALFVFRSCVRAVCA